MQDWGPTMGERMLMQAAADARRERLHATIFAVCAVIATAAIVLTAVFVVTR
jgi:hypothetical protein